MGTRIFEREEDILTKERQLEIDAVIRRMMKIRRIRNKKRIARWLKCHIN